MTITHAIASAASKDAGNLSMQEAGRSSWSREDYNAAVREYDRLLPVEEISQDIG